MPDSALFLDTLALALGTTRRRHAGYRKLHN